MRFAPVKGSFAVFKGAGNSVRGLSAEMHAAENARQHSTATQKWTPFMLVMR